MKKNKRKIEVFLGIFIFALLLGIVLGGGQLLFKTNNNRVLDEVVLKNNSNKDLFAIYVEELQDDGTSKYVKSNNTSFLEYAGHKYNEELSGCVDGSGNPIDGSMKYNEDGTISLKTKNASLCYVYFDIKKATLADIIIESSPNGLTKTVNEIDEMEYRFEGADNVDNYICFGKDGVCSLDSEYMYRIIGIDNKGRLKLIKEKALDGYYHWHENDDEDAVWDKAAGKITADLFNKLNGSDFINNSKYITDNWADKIDLNNWYIGKADYQSFNYDIADQDTALTYEQAEKAITPSKIGLVYLSDVFYTYRTLDTDIWSDESLLNITDSWLTKRLSNSSILTMVRQSNGNYIFYFAPESNSGPSVSYFTAGLYADGGMIFPVFYLNKNVEPASNNGTGTSTSPFIIS